MTIHRKIDAYSLPQLRERFGRPESELRELIVDHDIFVVALDPSGDPMLDEVGCELLRGAILGPDRDKLQELQRMTHYVKQAIKDHQRATGALLAAGAIGQDELSYIKQDAKIICRLVRACNKFASAAGLERPFDIEISR